MSECAKCHIKKIRDYYAYCYECGNKLEQENAELQQKLKSAKEKADGLQEALEALVTAAELRGDTILPPAEDDPKFWTELMQTAWDNAKFVLSEESTRDE